MRSWPRAIRTPARRRRIVTDDLLRDVARIYEEDTTGAPTRAVADKLFTSHRNAVRWVALARKRGFLAEYVRAGKS